MIYDFDNVPSRKGTYSLKYDFGWLMGHDDDEIPMWVADMDFPAAPGIVQAIKDYADKGFFGYSGAEEDYIKAAIGWFDRRHDVLYDKDWIWQTPGVVFAIYTAVRAFTKPGDAVAVMTPVYYPFYSAIEDSGRKVVSTQLVYHKGQKPAYTIDFDDFERTVMDNDAKMLVLCSPHNPVGRVWTADELHQLGVICKRHGVIVVADEIHCDLVMPGYKHVPTLNAMPEMAQQLIVCTAPSKSFNLAGMATSNIWIPNHDMLETFRAECGHVGSNGVNILGLIACMAAYTTGEEWLDQVVDYIAGNAAYMNHFLRDELPQLSMVPLEGTYLTWVDCSALGMNFQELDEFIAKKAKLWLDGGSMFGRGGEAFQRFNVACPRDTVQRAMHQLRDSVREL